MSSPASSSEQADPALVPVRRSREGLSPWTILNSALLATLASASLYFLGFMWTLSVAGTLGVPPAAVSIEWMPLVRRGSLIVFDAAKPTLVAAGIVLLSAFLLGPSLHGRLRRLAAREEVDDGVRLVAGGAANLLEPRRLAERFPRWAVALLGAGFLSSWAAIRHAYDAPSLPPGEASTFGALAHLDVVVVLAFLAAIALDRPSRAWSLHELVRRGGAVMYVLLAAAGVAALAHVASDQGAYEAALAGDPASGTFPLATLQMKDAASPYHGQTVVLYYQTEAHVYVRAYDPTGGTLGPVVMLPLDGLASIVYG